MSTPIASRSRLFHALLFAAGRFVPVPLLDDIVREQVALYAVTKAVEGHARSVPRAHLAPLAAPADGCFAGCLGTILMLPIKLILFPIRKVLSVFFAVRNVSRDIVEIVLLTRLVDRAIERGEIDAARSAEAQRAESLLLRQALDAALKGTNVEILSATLRAVLGPIRGIILSGLAVLRTMRRQGQDAPPPTDPTLLESTSRLERAFDRPEVRALIESLDQKVDTELARLRSMPPA